MAEALRAEFISLEDLRDQWGPARVLHAAIESAGIAQMGEIPPYVSGLSAEQLKELEAVVKRIQTAELESECRVAAIV